MNEETQEAADDRYPPPTIVIGAEPAAPDPRSCTCNPPFQWSRNSTAVDDLQIMLSYVGKKPPLHFVRQVLQSKRDIHQKPGACWAWLEIPKFRTVL